MKLEEVKEITKETYIFCKELLKNEFSNLPIVEIENSNYKNSNIFGIYDRSKNKIYINTNYINNFIKKIMKQYNGKIIYNTPNKPNITEEDYIRALVLEIIIHETMVANEFESSQKIDYAIKLNAVPKLYNKYRINIVKFLSGKVILFRDFTDISFGFIQEFNNIIPQYKKASDVRIIWRILNAFLTAKCNRRNYSKGKLNKFKEELFELILNNETVSINFHGLNKNSISRIKYRNRVCINSLYRIINNDYVENFDFTIIGNTLHLYELDSEVIEFIKSFLSNDKYDIMLNKFYTTYSYQFAEMLKSTFDRGTVCWLAPHSHIVWMDDNGVPYDIKGLNKDKCEEYIPVHYLGDSLEYFKHIRISRTLPAEEIREIIDRYIRETKW